MTDERMSIAFLAPNQNDNDPRALTAASKLSPISSLSSPTSEDREDSHLRSCDDNHQGTIHPARINIHHQQQHSSTSDSITSEPKADQLHADIDTLPSPSPIDPADLNPFRRQRRSSRPAYSEEQRFFVMHARIIQNKSWTDIEEDFTTIFKQRSKGGLCSLYYRIRRSWGLEDVLKSGSSYWALERQAVMERAGGFSREFLTSIGYLRP